MLESSLSVAVTSGEMLYDSSQTIVSQLLLSSEIRGAVYNPAYYFASAEDSVARQLDLVMMTNGWRRFAWEDVLAGKTPSLRYTPDSNYYALVGRIDKLSDRQKKDNTVNLILHGKDNSTQIIATPLRADGSFREDDLVLYDTTKVYYKLNNKSIPSSSNVHIGSSLLSFDPGKKYLPLMGYLSDTAGLAQVKMLEEKQRMIEELLKQTTLQEVVVTSKVKTRLQEIDEQYTTGLFQGANGQGLNLVDDGNVRAYPNIFEYIRTRVPRGGAARPAGFKPLPVSFFIDEIPADSTDMLELKMVEIAYVKTFTGSFAGAESNGGGGVIAVYTKKGADSKEVLKGLDHVKVPGYTAVKEFYSPDYSETGKNFSNADIRTTIYWAPELQMNAASKKLRFSFYNNDISQSLQVVVEGMAADGRLVYISKLLK